MMALLFDHNLSPKLTKQLVDLYPDSTHVYWVGLDIADDRTVWNYARDHHFVIVTKDADYSELLLLHSYPPKIIWIRRGNCSTREIESLLRDNFEIIETSIDDPNTGIITLY